MGTTTSSNTNSEKPVDPQAGQETDTDLPF